MRTVVRSSLAAAMVLSLAAATALAGKPPKNPPPPPPPPVIYTLQVYDMPTTEAGPVTIYNSDIASDGTIVGYFKQNGVNHAYLYNSATDQAFNLNDVGVIGLPSGWRIAAALAINNHGCVVGAIEEIANPGTWRGYILDIWGSPPLLTTLPDGPDHTYPKGINDKMEIVGVRLGANGRYRGYVFNALEPVSKLPEFNRLASELHVGVTERRH
jgi:hypothetical protein